MSSPDTLFSHLRMRLDQEGLVAPLWPEAPGRVTVLDQTRLPFERVLLTIQTPVEMATVIGEMRLRGSGAIGCAGAFGAYLAVQAEPDHPALWESRVQPLIQARPTALILQTAIQEVLRAAQASTEPVLAAAQAAVGFFEGQLEAERAIGYYGASLIPDGATVLTHCHSGALAGAGYGGRALSVIRGAVEAGKKIQVISQETRPYLQGARITAWELQRLGIPVRLATDGMAGALMQAHRVDVCVVGSDRLAANGDLANKVGTYLVALAAHEHGVPFYTATTRYNIDLRCPTGAGIPIEERSATEVLTVLGQAITAPGIQGVYIAFDITPARLISGIVTERGVLRPPYPDAFKEYLNISSE